jgi:hypothetical protein
MDTFLTHSNLLSDSLANDSESSFDAFDAFDELESYPVFGDTSTPVDFDHPGGVWSSYCVIA